ncbi:uncharacterized protein BDV17DRAFT_218914 [Aspergillus undulatus]|uniref:uncharacterized protein n=1 Tax=Aspergillus undulatus TaxID=1810928 RepID=UPI003CCD3ACA
MTTRGTVRILANLWLASSIFASAFDPLGIVYEVASPHLVRRAGILGGSTPTITETGDSERPYAVDGNTFADYDSAAQRSCNIQYDSCQLAANTDSSASFSLEDCQNQQNDCIADPPAVGDGDTTMSVVSDDTSDTTGSDSTESDTDMDETESNAADSDAAESGITESSAANTADTADTANIAATESASDDGSDTTSSDTMDSNTAESESETEQESAEQDITDESDATETYSAAPDTTQAEPVLVSQTTIPYDAEFDLVCDL